MFGINYKQTLKAFISVFQYPFVNIMVDEALKRFKVCNSAKLFLLV